MFTIEPETRAAIKGGPLENLLLGEKPLTAAKRQRLMREKRERLSALDPYVASIELLLHADDLIPDRDRDRSNAEAAEKAAAAAASSARSGNATRLEKMNRKGLETTTTNAVLNAVTNANTIALESPLTAQAAQMEFEKILRAAIPDQVREPNARFGPTKLSSAVPEYLLAPPTLLDANGSSSRLASQTKSHLTVVRQLMADSEARRRRYNTRFEFVGSFWQRKLRHCTWRQSLRMAFEVPSLHAAKYAEMGHLIDKPQFIAACNYAISRNASLISSEEFDHFFNACFDIFDVEAQSRIDYREFLSVLLFFRVSPENDPAQLIEMWYRYYDGDTTRGLTFADFLKMMVTLCITPEETERVIRLMDLKSLEVAGAASETSKLGAYERYEKRVTENRGFGGKETLEAPMSMRVVNGQIIVNGGGGGSGGGGGRGNGLLSTARPPRRPGDLIAHPTLGSMLDETLKGMTDEEKRKTVLSLEATRLDARMLRADSRVNTADVISDAHNDLMGLNLTDRGGGMAPAVADPYSRRHLYEIDSTAIHKDIQEERLTRTKHLSESGSSSLPSIIDSGAASSSQNELMLSRRHNHLERGAPDPRESIFYDESQIQFEEEDEDNVDAHHRAEMEQVTKRKEARGTGAGIESKDESKRPSSSSQDETMMIMMNNSSRNSSVRRGDFRHHNDDDDDLLDYGAQDEQIDPSPPTLIQLEVPLQENPRPTTVELTFLKRLRLKQMKDALDKAAQDDNDPNAPWNRGTGTLTEVRAVTAHTLHQQRLMRTTDEQTRFEISKRPSTREALFHIPPPPKTYITIPVVERLSATNTDGERTVLYADDRNDPETLEGQLALAKTRASMRFGDSIKLPKSEPDPTAPPIYGATVALGDDNVGVTGIDPIRGHVLRHRREERLRKGRLIEPLKGVKRITLHMIRYLVQMSPGLTDEIHRLRLMRVPAIVRSGYMTGQLEKQIKLSQAKYDKLRDDVQTKRALTLWRSVMLSKHFARMKFFTRFVIWQRIKVNSVRARRAVRNWYARKQIIRVDRAQSTIARTHYLNAFMTSTFKQWFIYTRYEQRKFKKEWEQASKFNRHCLLAHAWSRCKMRTKFVRACKFYVAHLAARVLAGWHSTVQDLLREKREIKMRARVQEETQFRVAEVVHKTAVAEEAQAAFEEQTAEYEAFAAEAARLAEEKRLEEARDLAERHLIKVRKLEAQRTASEENYLKRKAAFIKKFEDGWKARIKSAVFGARAEAEQYCASKDGKNEMSENAKKMLMASNVEQLNQEDSTWYAEFDLTDGCIHFIRPADPTANPPLERLDLNFDQMRLDDAILVASAHYIAKMGVKLRKQTLVAKDKDWVNVWANQCSRVFAQRWRARKGRLDFLKERRLEIETMVDPFTGNLFYEVIKTGLRFDQKPLTFRADPVHPPEPLWFLQCKNVANEETGIEEPGWVYQHRKIPWKWSRVPPDNFRMCNVCSSDFATRRCVGEGCEGLCYCFACFKHYHPLDNYDWNEHWTLHQSRIPVQAVSKAEKAAEDAAIASGKTAAEAAAAIASAMLADQKAAVAFQKRQAEATAAASLRAKEESERGSKRGGSVRSGSGNGSRSGSRSGSRRPDSRSKSPDDMKTVSGKSARTGKTSKGR